MIHEPTREQLDLIDDLAGTYDSVRCEPSTERPRADLIDALHASGSRDWILTCYRQRPSGARIVVEVYIVNPDGRYQRA